MQGKIKLNVEELAIESFDTDQVAAESSNTAYTDCYVYTNCLGSCNLSCRPTECGACTYTCNYQCW
jgi:hypothetical protein